MQHLKTNLYKTDDTNIILVAGVIFRKGNQVLLVWESDDDIWKLPGGTAEEKDNTLIDTVNREVFEELNINPEVDESTPLMIYSLNRIPYIILLFSFVQEWKPEYDNVIEIKDDVEKMQWFDINNLPDTASPSIKYAVREFLAKV